MSSVPHAHAAAAHQERAASPDYRTDVLTVTGDPARLPGPDFHAGYRELVARLRHDHSFRVTARGLLDARGCGLSVFGALTGGRKRGAREYRAATQPSNPAMPISAGPGPSRSRSAPITPPTNIPKTVAPRRARASAGARAGPERNDRTSVSALYQTYLHHRGRHVRDTRLDHRSAAPPHGASEQHDDDSHGVRRKALRSARWWRRRPRRHISQRPRRRARSQTSAARAHSPHDDGVSCGDPGHESSQGLGRTGNRRPRRVRDPETEQQDIPGGERGEGVPQPEEGNRIDRAGVAVKANITMLMRISLVPGHRARCHSAGGSIIGASGASPGRARLALLSRSHPCCRRSLPRSLLRLASPTSRT